jgi:RimJ/RimL family protein N-acetyltransferase
MTLEDDAILLRSYTDEDVPALVAAINDREISRWTRVPFPYTEEDAREFMRSTSETAFAVTNKRTGDLLGGIGLRLPAEGIGEVGYWVRREARGRGVATRALLVLSRWALEEKGLARLQLTAEPGNVASQRVAEKAGYVREGLLRRFLIIGGERRDCVIYSLLPGDL